MWLLLFLIFCPLAGALLVFSVKKSQGSYWALFFAMMEMLGTLFIWADFDKKTTVSENLFYQIKVPWLEVINSNLHFGIDGIGMLMLFLVNVLLPLIVLSAFNEKKPYPNNFFGLILLMQFGLTLIPIWFVSGLWGQEDKRIQVTRKFFIYTFCGSLFMLVGLIYVYQFSDSFALLDLYRVKLDLNQEILVFWLIFFAFAVKFPLFPFHTWLPDTHTYAPTQGSMLLSGIMLKMAVYGMIRYLLPIVPNAIGGFSGELVIIFAIIGVLYGAMIALISKNIKTIIAYSSISHLGMMGVGILASTYLTVKGSFTTEGAEGAMLQTMAHGINAVGLFYCADILYKRFHTKDITQMGGMARVAPKFAVLFIILIFGAMAVPLTNGFVGEFILLKTIFEYNKILGIIAGLSIVLGAAYLLRLYSKAMFGEGNEKVLSQIQDVSWIEFSVLLVLGIFVLFFGVFPNFILDLVREPLNIIFQTVQNKVKL